MNEKGIFGIKEILQEKLNYYFNFNTEVDIETNDNKTRCKISIADENSVIGFTIKNDN